MTENIITSAAGVGSGPSRRGLIKTGIGLGALAVLSPALTACADGAGSSSEVEGAIKIGLLTDLSGTTSFLGRIQMNCMELAVKQINATGGIAGRKIQVVKEDDGSDSTQTIEKSTKLALKDEVTAVFGLITSLEREAALTVLPNEKVPLFYSTYYEGAAAGAVACDPYLIATGQVPNQQVETLVPYLTKNVGTSYTFVGSDYIWPRGTYEVLDELVTGAGGVINSETYYAFGTTDFGPVFQQLEKDGSDICWVQLVGADFTTFLGQYKQFGAKARLVSIAVDEAFAASNPGTGTGAITSQSYFMSVDTPENQKFLADYRKEYGQGELVNAIGEAAYNSIYLFKNAVEAADGNSDPEAWMPKLSGSSFAAPSGTVQVDAATQHTVSTSFLGELQGDGTIAVLEQTDAITPVVAGCNLA